MVQGTKLLLVLCCLLAPASSNANSFKQQERFATWSGIEPDKWATIWLIKRYLSPKAYFLFFDPGSDLPLDATPFGVPHAEIKRANRESMYRRLIRQAAIDNNRVAYIDDIIQDIEVNIWDAPKHKHSLWFEAMYRKLQARYARDLVPIDCYMLFFDRVAELASDSSISGKIYQEKLNIETQCPGSTNPDTSKVLSFTQLEILRKIGLGQTVIFVDTREDEEYEEVHLPGAKVLKLRDVNTETAQQFSDTDWVIPYCVKDFRGFEVAKALKSHGVKQVATLSPHGLKGWLDAGLPVVKNNAEPIQAFEALKQCAVEPRVCIHE